MINWGEVILVIILLAIILLSPSFPNQSWPSGRKRK